MSFFGEIEWKPPKPTGGDGFRGARVGGQRGPYPAEKRRIEFCEFFRGHFAPYIA